MLQDSSNVDRIKLQNQQEQIVSALFSKESFLGINDSNIFNLEMAAGFEEERRGRKIMIAKEIHHSLAAFCSSPSNSGKEFQTPASFATSDILQNFLESPWFHAHRYQASDGIGSGYEQFPKFFSFAFLNFSERSPIQSEVLDALVTDAMKFIIVNKRMSELKSTSNPKNGFWASSHVLADRLLIVTASGETKACDVKNETIFEQVSKIFEKFEPLSFINKLI